MTPLDSRKSAPGSHEDRTVAVVADDLTGANDTAVQFASRGWPTLVALGRSRPSPRLQDPWRVVAAVTDARAEPEGVAEERTADTVRELSNAGATALYVKIDSTLRGSVAAQIRGGLRAWGERHPDAFAVVCPAYPAMGRTVEVGTALLHGRLLQDGSPGDDPVTPVGTSVVRHLVDASDHVSLPATRHPEAVARLLQERAGPGAVLSLDAREDRDLELIAAAVTLLGPHVVPAGSAGLASALAGTWAPAPLVDDPPLTAVHRPGPAAVLVSSVNQMARRQQRALAEEYGDRMLTLSPPLDAVVALDRLLSWFRQHRPPSSEKIIVVAAPDRDTGSGPAEAGLVARGLAECVALIREAHGLSGVVVTGGDGARALLHRWDCTGIAVESALVEGMPHGVLVGGDVHGLPIVTKAGGFGDAEALVRAVGYTVGKGAAAPEGDRPGAGS
jgi:uncharacterized protein YgbK (DUF1537 family)